MILKKIHEELVLIRKELQVIRYHLESMNPTVQDLHRSSSKLGAEKLFV